MLRPISVQHWAETYQRISHFCRCEYSVLGSLRGSEKNLQPDRFEQSHAHNVLAFVAHSDVVEKDSRDSRIIRTQRFFTRPIRLEALARRRLRDRAKVDAKIQVNVHLDETRGGDRGNRQRLLQITTKLHSIKRGQTFGALPFGKFKKERVEEHPPA